MTYPTRWPDAALPMYVARVLLSRFGPGAARDFLRSARRAQPYRSLA